MTTAIQLYNPVLRGNAHIGPIADNARNYQDSTRRIGGYWQASFDYGTTRDERDEMFFAGLMREVRRYSAGEMRWQGFIANMDYQRGGRTFRRSMLNVCNAAKCMYTRLNDNLLTNGSAESGAWTVYNGATVTQVSADNPAEWAADGNFACKIVVADATIRGADVQTSVAILANTLYNFSLAVNVMSGSWRIAINKVSDDSKIVATSTRGVVGVQQIKLTIPEANVFAGNVRVRITSEAAPGTIYGDAGTLVQASFPADTGWFFDQPSIAEHSRIDNVLLESSLSEGAALGKVLAQLRRNAWPRTVLPSEIQAPLAEEDRLTILCLGYVHTFLWRVAQFYDGVTGTQDQAVALIAGLSSFVTAGLIESNPQVFTFENRAPITYWQMLKQIAHSGDANGELWSLGVYADRKLNYTAFPTTIGYHLRGNDIYGAANVPIESWFLDPAWGYIDDAPIVAFPPDFDPAGAVTPLDDPRRMLIEEVAFIAPDGYQLHSEVSE